MILPFRYTLPRDCGGFAIYFGTYTFLRNEFWESDLIQSYLGKATPSQSFNTQEQSRTIAKVDEEWSLMRQVGLTIGGAILAGSSAGVLTFFWRNPWDSLYKRQMGWESATTQGNWWSSGARFVRSPRGLQAVGISGITWAAYETAILVTSLIMEDYRNESKRKEPSL